MDHKHHHHNTTAPPPPQPPRLPQPQSTTTINNRNPQLPTLSTITAPTMLFPECEQPAVTTPVNVFKTPTSRRHTLSTPSPSSPLSSRRTAGFALSFGSNPGCMLPSPPRSPPSLLAPKRLFKPIPSGRTNGEEGRKTRRCQFLKKVQTGREDKAWKARGGEDEVCRVALLQARSGC